MFKKFDLMASETPLVFYPDLSGSCGTVVHIKREDQCGIQHGFGGMATRKLEFTLVDMAERKTTDLVVVGRYGSPYTRQLVREACRMRVICHCVFVDDYTHDHASFLSDLHLCGATTYGTCDPHQVNGLIHALKEEGSHVYISHYEGSNAVAAMGGFSLMEELHLDLTKRSIAGANIYVGCTAGTTLAGMLAGLHSIEARGFDISGFQLVGVPVQNQSNGTSSTVDVYRDFVTSAYTSLRELASTEGIDLPGKGVCGEIAFSEVPDDGVMSFHAKIDFAKTFYQQTGIILDAVLGIPVARAMLADIKKHRFVGEYVFINPVISSSPYFNYTAE